jgi:60 kDa SS-A/Ro ribonucleoprotein
MANKSLFSSFSRFAPRANAINRAGGRAYKLSPKHALAQIASTGCFNGTYYTNASSQLEDVLKLINQVDDNEFLAKLAVYSRERAFMKDMPAAILVILSTRDTKLMHQVFDRVADNGRVLRTVFQMVRSGQFGRKSLSSSMQRAFQRWLNDASVGKLLSASIGNDPSLRDVLRLARPTPKDNARRALFGYLTQKETEKWAPATPADLPSDVQSLIAFRRSETAEAQTLIAGDLNVRWDLLADSVKGPLVWKAIARQMGPQALRMNLNTLYRHDVFRTKNGALDREMVSYVAGRLADPDSVRRSRQFPYQFFAAYLNANDEIPHAIKSALHEAAELACGNVPQLPGPVVIGLDTSGSMSMPVTGNRGRGATSKIRCIDVASLFASAILRRNPDSVVIPFDTSAYKFKADAGDTILSLASRLAKFGGGGTNCSLPLHDANTRLKNRRFAGLVLVSDNQSWVGKGGNRATAVMTEWKTFVDNQTRFARQQGESSASAPKMVCIDIQPYTTSQAPERSDILNIGGFNDAVFKVVSSFMSSDEGRFVDEIESIEL